MTLSQWQANGWLEFKPTSAEEIRNLLAISERDLEDATAAISADWQFGIACNAALKLCAVLLRAEGYRPARGLQHFRTIMALPLILGASRKDDADYLNSCRAKRNTIEYDYVGGASVSDAKELVEFTKALQSEVTSWLRERHPEL